MIEFVAGVFASVAIFSLCGTSYWLGTKRAHKAILEPVDSKKKDAMATQAEGMQKILNYDVNMAYKARGGAK